MTTVERIQVCCSLDAKGLSSKRDLQSNTSYGRTPRYTSTLQRALGNTEQTPAAYLITYSDSSRQNVRVGGIAAGPAAVVPGAAWPHIPNAGQPTSTLIQALTAGPGPAVGPRPAAGKEGPKRKRASTEKMSSRVTKGRDPEPSSTASLSKKPKRSGQGGCSQKAVETIVITDD